MADAPEHLECPQTPDARRARRVAALAGVAVTALVLFLSCNDVSHYSSYEYGDWADQFFPRASEMADAFKGGRLPLWDPNTGCGTNLLADPQTSPFYPPRWIFCLTSARLGMAVLVVLHLLTAGLGTFAWLRANRASAWSALLASGTYMFGIVAESWCVPMFYSLSWVPALLWAIDAPGPFTRRRWAALAAVLGLQLLAGHIQIFTYTALFLLLYVGFRAVQSRTIRLPALVLLAYVAAVALGAVVLLPTAAHVMRESDRALSQLQAEQVHYLWGVAPHKLKLLAGMIPKTVTNVETMRVLSNIREYGYLGVVFPVALGACVFVRPLGRVVFLLVVMLLGLYLATGLAPGLLPLYEWFCRLPVVGAFRTPDRLLLWYLLAGCALMALGADRVWHAHGSGRVVTTEGGHRGVVVVVGVVVLIRLAVITADVLRGTLLMTRRILLCYVLWFVGMGLIVASSRLRSVSKRAGRGRAVLLGVLFVVLLADFWFNCPYVAPYVRFPAEQFEQVRLTGGDRGAPGRRILGNEELAKLGKRVGSDRLFLADPYNPVIKPATVPAFRSLPFYDALPFARHMKVSRLIPRRDVEQAHRGRFYCLSLEGHLRFYDLCSVELLVSLEPIPDAEQHGWRPEGKTGDGARVYRNLWCVPRFSLHSRWDVLEEEEILRRVIGQSDGRALPVLLERRPDASWAQNQGMRSEREAPEGEAERIRVIRDDPERIELETFSSGARLLVVTDSFADGWTCSVDGQSAPILRANYLHRAVALAPGTHRVRFRYRPPGLRLGLAASCAAVLLLLVAAWAPFPARWRRRES